MSKKNLYVNFFILICYMHLGGSLSLSQVLPVFFSRSHSANFGYSFATMAFMIGPYSIPSFTVEAHCSRSLKLWFVTLPTTFSFLTLTRPRIIQSRLSLLRLENFTTTSQGRSRTPLLYWLIVWALPRPNISASFWSVFAPRADCILSMMVRTLTKSFNLLKVFFYLT